MYVYDATKCKQASRAIVFGKRLSAYPAHLNNFYIANAGLPIQNYSKCHIVLILRCESKFFLVKSLVLSVPLSLIYIIWLYYAI